MPIHKVTVTVECRFGATHQLILNDEEYTALKNGGTIPELEHIQGEIMQDMAQGKKPEFNYRATEKGKDGVETVVIDWH
ncbi:MAG: hypothetical protein IKH84_06775 [Ottowia sp.]|nr:hypothetical protein [Ottowia sp.]